MMLLGLLLLAATAAFTVLLIVDNWSGTPEHTVTVLGNDIATMSTLEAFCAGLALALIFGLALMLAAAGAKHSRRRARRRREERRAARSARYAEAERDDLAAELERERATSRGAAATGPAEDQGRDDGHGTAAGEPVSPAGTGHQRGRRHLFGH